MSAHDRDAERGHSGPRARRGGPVARAARTSPRHRRWLALGVALATMAGPVIASSPALAGVPGRRPVTAGRPAAAGALGATLASPRVAGRPADPPIGVPFQTLSSEAGGAIRIDGQAVPGTDSHGDGFNYAAISRSTRGVEKSGTVSNTQAGMQELAGIEKEYARGDGYLMVVSGTRGLADDPVLIRQFTGFVHTLGGTLTTPDDKLFLARSRFSVVGIPGGAGGSAWVDVQHNPHFAPPGSPYDGNITGYLQVNSATDQYNYVSPDLETFDTSAARTGTSNTVVVQTAAGAERYTASLPAGYTAGFQVVVLDRLSLKMISNEAFPTNGPQAAAEIAVRQQEFATHLARDARLGGASVPPGTPSGDDPLILVQSIGHPKGQSPGWAADPRGTAGAANVITSLGGQRTIFTQLNGESDDYALAGGLGFGRAALEASSDEGQPGPISGVLARAHGYGFQPVTGGPAAGINTELVQMSYEKPVAFPSFAAAPLQAAETYIGDNLRLCPAGTAVCRIRPLYYSSASENWATDAGRLRALPDPGGTPGFNPAEFRQVKDQLVDEFDEVAQVRSYFDALRAPYGTALQNGRIDVKTLGNALVSAVTPPPADTKTPFYLGIAGKIASLGGIAPPPFNGIAAGISAVFGFASLLAGGNGDSALADNVRTRADALTDQMYTRLIDSDDSITGMEKLFLSDYGKLQGVWDNRNKDGWRIDIGPTSLNKLILATRQWFAEQLVPYAYTLGYLAFGSSDANGMDCLFPPVYRFVWADMPRNAQRRIIGSYASGGTPQMANIYFSAFPVRQDYRDPPQGVADLLFNPSADPRSGPLGINILSFVNGRFFDAAYAENDVPPLCGYAPIT
jgi:hypothetical protein